MKIIIYLMLCCFVTGANAASDYAKVVDIKGMVSQLAPGKRHPTWIKKGDSLIEDTSVLTGDKSFIKLRILNDGSSVTLGPKSKIVLTKVEKKRGTIIGMLTGTLRANIVKEVAKEGQDPNKMYIKTRTAAMGIRGTELVVAMNRGNNVTSLVTLDGEVSMSKVDPHDAEVKVEEVVHNAVANKEAAIVQKGRAATSYLHKEELTVPTKVNPVQLVALKKNETLQAASEDDVKKVEKIEMTEDLKKELYAPDTEEEIAQGIADVPENGAFVDLKSAIFIPAVKDKDAEVGSIDAKTGEYIPPEGVELDVKKGFIAKNDADENAKKIVSDLNNAIEYEEVPDDFAPGHTSESEGYTDKADNAFGIKTEFAGISYKFGSRSKSTSTVAATRLMVTLGYDYIKNYRSSFLGSASLKAFSLDKSDYEQKNATEEDENIGFKLMLGHRYKVGRDYAISAKFIYEEDFFPIFALDNFLNLYMRQMSVALPKAAISVKTNLTQNNRVEAGYIHIFSGQNKDIYVTYGKSMQISYTFNFGSDKNHQMGAQGTISDYSYNNVELRRRDFALSYRYGF